MAIAVQQVYPIAHVSLVLGVLRRLEVATVIARLIPPHPAHVLSCGRGGEALVLAILDGDHALYKVGKRLEERGMVTLLQPGLTRAARHDYRLGYILDALFAANLHTVFRAGALKALEVYAIPTPWRQQDTTTIALYGAYEDAPQTPGAPRPIYGHSKDGRDDLKQVLLSLGVSGDGSLPVRLGRRDGNRSDSVETPLAIEGCLALGLEGVRGIVDASRADSHRTLGLCTVLGLLVYSVIQRQVRLSLRTNDQQLPGNTGMTATPTAAVVLALFTHVALVQLQIGEHEVRQLSGVQPHHRLVCEALGLDSSWYAVPSGQKNGKDIQTSISPEKPVPAEARVHYEPNGNSTPAVPSMAQPATEQNTPTYHCV